MKIRFTVAFTIIIVFVSALISSGAFYLQVPVGAQLSPNLMATKVDGPIDLSKPGRESFWSQISGAEIPLTSSNNYGGRSNPSLSSWLTMELIFWPTLRGRIRLKVDSTMRQLNLISIQAYSTLIPLTFTRIELYSGGL
jgi:hypothetical protein